jgi:hypothetical protein
MMRFAVSILACTLLGAPAWAGVGDALPPNPCGGPKELWGQFQAVLDVSGGGCSGAAPTAAETVITCTLRKNKPVTTPADIAVEFYSPVDGSSMTGGPVCVASQLPVGSTVTVVTGVLPTPSPYSSAVVVSAPGGTCGPGCFLHGTARVFSSGGLLICSATRVDLSEVCFAGKSVPATTSRLKTFKPHSMHTQGQFPVVQYGD